MPFHPLLLLRIALIQEGKLDYFSAFALVLVVAVGALAGIWLWLIGLDLVRSRTLASRVGAGWCWPWQALTPWLLLVQATGQ
jgi:hypothetical protein